MNWLLFFAESAHDTPTLLDPHQAGLIFWTTITFMLVLVVLYKATWTPLMDALDLREANIAGKVQEADGIKAEAEKTRQEYEAQLEGIRQEAQKIIDEGESDKKRIISDAQAKANEEAQAVRGRAEREIDLAKTKALAELKSEAVGLGMLIAERVIGAEVDKARHQTLVDEVLTSYERG